MDDTGASLRLDAPARRVLSTSPHLTELLFEAGAAQRLVGVPEFSHFPDAARALPRIGNAQRLDLERIAALRPDLIFAWQSGNNARQIAKLRALGIPVFVSEPRQFEDIPRTLERMGFLLGTRSVAEKAANRFRDQLRELQTQYAGRASMRVFVQIWERPLMTLNRAHLVTKVIELCGGKNVFAELPALVPTISTESVLQRDPQMLLAASEGAASGALTHDPDHPGLPPSPLKHWQAQRSLSAVQTQSWLVVPGDWLTQPTPRLILGIQSVCRGLDRARAAQSNRPLS